MYIYTYIGTRTTGTIIPLRATRLLLTNCVQVFLLCDLYACHCGNCCHTQSAKEIK